MTTVVSFTILSDMQDLKGYKRINQACKIEYVIENGDQTDLAESRNFSEGGICLITDKLLEVDTVIKCKIHLQKEKKPILVLGKIVWINKKEFGPRTVYDNGICFIRIAEEDRKILAAM